MSIKKMLAVVAVAAMTAAGATFVGTTSASALTRHTCDDSGYLWIYSNETTCWMQAGVLNVSLYSTVGESSGNNAGRVDGPGFYRTFAKNTVKTWNSVEVTKVTIN